MLDYLEKDARQRTGGKNGVYEFYTDDAGNSLLIIDGHIFHGRLQSGDILPISSRIGRCAAGQELHLRAGNRH